MIWNNMEYFTKQTFLANNKKYKYFSENIFRISTIKLETGLSRHTEQEQEDLSVLIYVI